MKADNIVEPQDVHVMINVKARTVHCLAGLKLRGKSHTFVPNRLRQSQLNV